MKLAVVIAAYDEEENVTTLFQRLENTLSTMADVTPEAIFVVEGRDRTRERLESLTSHLPWVRILYSEAPSGLGAAFRLGFSAVSDDADYVVTLDADLNHQPEEIPRLLAAAIENDCDILVGSRFVDGGTVEGTPLWKRFLSGTMNRVMSVLYDVAVRDKTSGFRIYRADLLRRITFRSDDFSFLPELLISAHAAGLRVTEVPIHFTHRRQGKSKMGIVPTTWSYLVLLWSRFDRLSALAAAFFLIGLAVRILATFPIHKYAADADGILSGLCAAKVLAGDTPVFFSGFRIGSLGCHVTAGFVAALGPDRLALAMSSLSIWAVTMVVWYLLCRNLFGRATALIALVFIALPSPWVTFTTYFPNGYPEIFLLCAALLWYASHLARRKSVPPRALAAFGILAGLGWWTSIQTLVCSGPGFVWLIWRRPDVRRPAAAVTFAAGTVVGAAPWLAFILRWGPQPSYSTQSAGEMAQYLDNLRYFFVYSLPELVSGWAPTYSGPEPAALTGLRYLTLGIYVAALGFVLYSAGRRAGGDGLAGSAGTAHNGRDGRGALALFALVAAAVLLVNVASAAGSARGNTIRYVLPLALAAPPLLAVFVHKLAVRTRAAAAASAAVIIAFNFVGVDMPWEPLRIELRSRLAQDEELVDSLLTSGVDVAMGIYWEAYPINFTSRGQIVGIPFERTLDVYSVAERVNPESRRWAFVDGRRRATTRWAQQTGLPFEEISAGERYWVALLDRPSEVSADDFTERLRRAYEAAP